uniref:Uncharacterized protein n=1 Tax=Opuntia streptacantha TaxID=393608 RepID=A0A7C9ASZ5_OPUST
MEESEKRRERLRAMRTEAQAEVQVGSNTCSPSQQSLSNPLLERPEDESRAAAPRFGFYTDPMAAFSTDKRRTGHQSRPHFPPSPSAGPKNAEMPFSGVDQFQHSYSPYPNMQQPGDPYFNPGASTSPMGIRSPYPVHQGSPSFGSAPGRGQWFGNSPSRGSGSGGGPYPVHQGSPNFRTPPHGRGHWSNNSPGPGLGRGGSPSPDMGRGRGWWDSSRMSPGPRYSGGRGRGSRFDGRAHSFYDKSMLEDPWESLTPVLWQGVSASRSILDNRPFFQKTPSAKKPRVSGTVDTSTSKQSLAEFLAASFEEAVGDATAE